MTRIDTGGSGHGGWYVRAARGLGGALVLLALSVALGGGANAQAPSKLIMMRGPDGAPLLRTNPDPDGSLLGASLSAAEARLRLRWEAESRVRDQLGPHGMPRKGLQMRDERVRRLMRSGGLVSPDTLRLLLIRISFESDRSGELTAVTTDGNFQLIPDPSVDIDPPPHDRSYFEAHMRGLAEYWGSMSGGLLVAETRVLPEGQEDSYRLSDIADYGPGEGGFWTVELLEKLVRDMIEAADAGTQADGSANLADFDFDDPNTYIIFAHAGADLQSNLVFTPGIEGYSPNDIPTFFVTLGDSAQVDLIGLDSDTGEPGRLIECSVIPETTSQDGLLGSIAAALMHEFGHALGLPDLYSTFTGLPTVGRWGIMDSGTNLAAAIGFQDPDGGVRVEVVVGALPPSATIWSKWFLGFAEDIRVGSATRNLDLAASYRQDTRQKAVRLDVASDEFFLLENRFVPPAVQPDWGLVSDPDTGVILYIGEFDGDELVGNTHLYDLFLPYAGGLHVWRVRQDRIEEKIYNNTVQALPGELGIELIEADGIQDIGVFEFSTIGFFGSDTDAFRDVSDFVYSRLDTTVTWDRTATEFGPDTFPASDSSFRIPTGVRLSDIGRATAQSIPFTARIEGLLDAGTGSGFPVEVPDAVDGAGGPILTRGDALSLTEAVVLGEPTLLFAAGSADGSVAPGLYAYDLGGSPRFADARVADFDAPLAGPPLWLPNARGSGSTDAMVVVTRTGTLGVLDPVAGGFTLTEHASADSADIGPLAVVHAAGWWIADGERAKGIVRLRDIDGAPIVGALDTGGAALLSDLVELRGADGSVRIAVLSTRGLEHIEPTVATPRVTLGPMGEHATRLVSWPIEGSADRLLIARSDGSLTMVERSTTGDWDQARAFARPLGANDVVEVVDLVVADVDGDGRNDVVVVTADRVFAFHESGADLRGFPVRLSNHFFPRESELDSFVSAAVVADLDADGRNEIGLVSRFGLLHAIGPEGGTVDGFPRKVSGGGVRAPLVIDAQVGAELRRGLVLFEALGDTLDSQRRTRSARLTAVDLGLAPTGADRPAEWLGFGGNGARSFRGTLGGAAAPGTVASAEARGVRVFPNPLRGTGGDAVFLRFFSGAPHTSVLTVFNLEGEEVRTVRYAVEAEGVPVQMEWSAAGLSSGPYLCRLDYTGPNGPDSDLVTLFIER